MSVIRHPSTGTAVTVKQWRYTATGGETTLSGTDGFGLSLSYTVGAEEVYINGVLLVRGTDYTASTGTSITGLTALVAGDVATVMSANAFNVANAIPLSQFTAKGDILVGTGASTEAALNVGADGTTLVANSSASTGLSWATPVASLANPIINGGFDIAQRGISVAVGAASVYTLDRWKAFRGGLVAGMTVSRQTTSDTTNLPNIQYCARVQRDSGNTSTGDLAFETGVETTNSIPFVGKAVTISFYARKGANFSSALNALSVTLYSGTGTDQVPDQYTGITNVGSTTATLTSTWQRFSFNATIGTTATEIGIFADYVPVGTAGAADYYEITGIQIDLGTYSTASVPTFRRSGGTLQGELAACQRYYWRNTAGGSYSRYALGIGSSSSQVWFQVYNPVSMRVSPTSIDYANLRTDDTGSGQTITALGFTGDGANPYTCNVYANVSSGITQFRPYILENNNNTAGYIGFSAEL
jgi:hypothetical protein